MKKYVYSAGLLAAIAGVGFCTQIEMLNKEIVSLLSPFRNNLTDAQVVFNKLEVNGERAVALDVSTLYRKQGSQNSLLIEIPTLSYSYPADAGARPETRLSLDVELDLVKLIGQQSINEMGPEADEIIKEFAAEFTGKYGDAATVDARITEQKTDDQGNLIELTLKLDGAVDLTALPTGVAVEDVLIQQVSVTAKAGIKGIAADVTLVTNPLAREFQQDDVGLKELIEGLLRRDQKTMEELVEIIQFLDQIGTFVVEYNPEETEAGF